MTIAEALEKRGEARGEKRGKAKRELEIAMAMLEQGLDKKLVAITTKVDLTKVEELSQQLKHSH